MNEILAPIYYQFCQRPGPDFLEFIECETFFCYSKLMAEIQTGFIRECDDDSEGIKSRVNDFQILL